MSFFKETLELEQVLDQGPCVIFRFGPEAFLGVCDSRPAPAGPSRPPVTQTLVVSTRALVDKWHTFLSAKGEDKINVTDPGFSERFKCYAFNFYDTNTETGLGWYRFEVQTFESSWPEPKCSPEQLEQVPLPPVWPQVLKMVVETNRGGNLSLDTIVYDWITGRNSIIIDKQEGDIVHDLELNNHSSYYWTKSGCFSIHMPVGILRPDWLKGARFIGKRTVNNIATNLFNQTWDQNPDHDLQY